MRRLVVVEDAEDERWCSVQPSQDIPASEAGGMLQKAL